MMVIDYREIIERMRNEPADTIEQIIMFERLWRWKQNDQRQEEK